MTWYSKSAGSGSIDRENSPRATWPVPTSNRPFHGWAKYTWSLDPAGLTARAWSESAGLLNNTFHAAENRHYVTDVHATIFQLLGLDARRLEIPGRKRLEIDYGHPINEIIA